MSLSCSFVWCWYMLLSAHPFHLSTCEIDYRPDKQRLEIAVKVFTDDLEEGLAFRFQEKIWLVEENEAAEIDRKLYTYLNEKVQINADQQPLAMSWVGKDVQMDVTWLFVEVENVPEVKQWEIVNRILFELFDDQRNMLTFRANGKKETRLFQHKESKHQVNFD